MNPVSGKPGNRTDGGKGGSVGNSDTTRNHDPATTRRQRSNRLERLPDSRVSGVSGVRGSALLDDWGSGAVAVEQMKGMSDCNEVESHRHRERLSAPMTESTQKDEGQPESAIEAGDAEKPKDESLGAASCSGYLCEFSKEQLQTISIACEVMSRLGMGQFRFAMDHLPMAEKIDWSKWHEDMDKIGKILSDHMPNNIDGWRSSLGIGNDDVNRMNQRAWDIHQTVRKHLSWEDAVENGIVESMESPRKWPEMMTVNYDDPLNISGEPLPKISSQNDQSAQTANPKTNDEN